MKLSVILSVLIGLQLSACSEVKTLYVSDQYVNCNTTDEQKCLSIKENETDDWTTIHNTIEGFTYEEGFIYKLNVKVTKTDPENPTYLKYILVKVLSKTKTGTMPQNQTSDLATLNGNWEVVEITDFDNETGKNPYFVINDGKINGNNGCNTFGGEIKIKADGLQKIEGMYQTKMFCVDTAGLEIQFTSALNEAALFKVENDTLYALDTAGKTLLKAITKADEKKNSEEKQAVLNTDFKVKYVTRSRGFERDWIYDGKTMDVQQISPSVEKRRVNISEKDQLAIEKMFQALDLDKLENLIPPSTKHQYDGAKHANLEVTINNKTYITPTFDHGNPPAYIKGLLEKLDKLALK